MDITYYIEGEKIDLFDDESILYRGKLVDSQDITALFSDFINTFSIPASTRNSRILKNWFEIGVNNGFNPNKRIDSYVEFNSIPFRFGKTALEEVREKEGKVSSYNITFYSEVSQLDEIFGDDKLKDLPLSKYDFAYDTQNINALFSNPTLLRAENLDIQPNFVMPFILSTDREVQYGGGSTSDISTTDGRLNIRDFRPAIRQTTIIEAIEELYQSKGTPVTFSNDFKLSKDFSNLFMQMNGNEEFDDTYSWYTLELNNSYEINNINTTPPDIRINAETNIVTIERRGSNLIGKPNVTPDEETNYGFSVAVFLNSTPLDGKPFRFRLRNVDTGEIIDTLEENTEVGAVVSADNFLFNDLTFIPNQNEVNVSRFTIEVFSPEILSLDAYVDIQTYSTPPGFISRIKINEYPQTIESRFNVRDNMPDITISDYIKNLIKQFKLIIRPIDSSNFVLQSINDYYQNGNEVNVTPYTDVNSVNTKVYKNNKEIDYKYNVSEDIIQQRRFNEQYGRYIGNSTKVYNVDNNKTQEVQIDFEVPAFVKLKNLLNNEKTNINVALYQTFEQGSFKKVFSENLLQFYYNGLTPVTNEDTIAGIKIDLDPEDNREETGVKGVNTTITILSIPICDSSNSYSFFQVSNCLDFSDTTINGWHGQPIEKNIYNINHKPWLDNLLNSDNRLLSFESFLPPQLVRELDLNSKIIYKNQKYNIEEFETDLTNGKTNFTLFPDFTNQFKTVGTFIEPNRFDFTYGGGFGTLTIRTDSEITDILTPNSWNNIIDVNQRGRLYTILFFVEERFSTSSRQGSISFRENGDLRIIDVRQNGRTDSIDTGATVNVTPSTVDIPAENTSYTFTVVTDSFWQIDNTDPNITFDLNFGFGTTDVTMFIDENFTEDNVNYTFVVGSATSNDFVPMSVTQLGVPYLRVIPDTIESANDGGSFSFDIESNQDYTISETSPFISGLTPTTGKSNTTVSFSVAPNFGTESRSADINIDVPSQPQLDTSVTINQEASSPNLGITPNSRTIEFNDLDTIFSINSNISWRITSNDSWITLSQSTGNGFGIINISVDENLGNQRVGTITVEGGSFTETFTLTQTQFVQLPPTEPGRPSSGLTVLNSGDRIDVNWITSTSNTSGATIEYKVFRRVNQGTFTLIDTVSSNRYTDFNLIGGNSYAYQIIAVDDLNQESTPSQEGFPTVVPKKLIIQPNSFNVGSSSGSRNVNVYSNITWNLEPFSGITYTNSNTTTNYTGNRLVSFSYPTNNTSSETQYRVQATDINNTIDDRCSVFQEGEAVELSIAPNSRIFTNQVGLTQTISVFSNSFWVVGSTPSWLSVSSTTGTGNGSFVITTDELNQGNERQFTLVVTANPNDPTTSVDRFIQITQEEATSNLSIIPTVRTVGSSSTSYSIAVSSNRNWFTSVSGGFLSVDTDSGQGTNIVGITVSGNSTSNERVGTITFNDGITTVTHTLTQQANPSQPTYFSHFVTPGSNGSIACGFAPSITVFSTSSTFGNSSRLFSNSSGTNPVSTGFYSREGVVLQTNSNGDVINADLCLI